MNILWKLGGGGQYPEWKPGTILHKQNQTDNNFYIIIRRNGNNVWFREIGHKIVSNLGDDDVGYEIPDKTKFISDEIGPRKITKIKNFPETKRGSVQVGRDFDDYAIIWDGKPYPFELDEADEVYTKGKKFVPGAVLFVSYGYDTNLNKFYIITKRSGNTISTRQLQTNKTYDTQLSGTEVPNVKKFYDSKEYQSQITNDTYVKIDKHEAYIWDGRPVDFDMSR